MSCTGFAPDFFNNVAAIAVVLMLTKVVMHRTRRGCWGPRLLAGLHLLTMLAAGGATWISLDATHRCDPNHHQIALYLLIAAGIGLLIDLLVEDVGRPWGLPISKEEPHRALTRREKRILLSQ
jgi:hypothetical protein